MVSTRVSQERSHCKFALRLFIYVANCAISVGSWKQKGMFCFVCLKSDRQTENWINRLILEWYKYIFEIYVCKYM